MKRLGMFALAAVMTVGSLAGCRGADSTDKGASGPKSDVGITKEPCPESEHKDRGCIYLGTISDLTVGPFHVLAVPITDAQKAFWKRVNAAAASAAMTSTRRPTSATTSTTRRRTTRPTRRSRARFSPSRRASARRPRPRSCPT